MTRPERARPRLIGHMLKDDVSKGVCAQLLACVIWGLSPLFYHELAHVPALDVLAHRMVWSLVFFGLVLALQRRLGAVVAAFATPRNFILILVAAVIIAVNWALFIWTVQIGQTTQSSLGYYIYPLVAVVIGRLVFAEALTAMQWTAVGLAAGAVVMLTFGVGTMPKLALALAVTFGCYGMLKKRLDLGPVVSVTAEVVVLSPIAVVMLLQTYHNGGDVFGGDLRTGVILAMAGPITAVPLILFSYAARRLAMTTVGLLQYINPTIQFGCAVFVFSEPFGPWHLAAFFMIWTALALYTASAWSQDRARRKAARQVCVSDTTS